MTPFSLSDVLQSLVDSPQAGFVREREVLRVAATLRADDRKVARNETLKWAAKRTGGTLPKSAWDHQEFMHFVGGRDCAGVRIVHDDEDIWAIRANDPDKTIAQRTWTTEIVVAAFGPAKAYFSLRLFMSSPEWDPDIAPAVPGLVQQIATKCSLCQGPDPVTMEPWILDEETETQWLIDSLVNPARRTPLVVLTVPDDSAPAVPSLDAESLARATLGLARVVVLPAPHTWALTKRFGKTLSVFNGAVRVYEPGFNNDAEPYSHRLLFVKSPAEGTRATAWLQQLVARASLRQFRLGHEVVSYASIRDRSHALKRRRLELEGATDHARLSAALEQIDSLEKSLQAEKEEGKWYAECHDGAEKRAQLAEAQLKNGLYRVQHLTAELRARGDDPDSAVPLPDSWSAFTEWCDRHLVGRVVLSPRARRAITGAQFQDVASAAGCVRWLANEYRERRVNGGDGNDLRVALQPGIRNDRCGADSFRFSWQGHGFDVEWHVKSGGNTRDPARCLRIYYLWDEANQQVVIASMPGHIRTAAT